MVLNGPKEYFSPCVFARRALLLEYVLLLINMYFRGVE